jgi:hypothetical protein
MREEGDKEEKREIICWIKVKERMIIKCIIKRYIEGHTIIIGTSFFVLH